MARSSDGASSEARSSSSTEAEPVGSITFALSRIGRRVAALFLLSVGLALLAGPLPTRRAPYGPERLERAAVSEIETGGRILGAALVLAGAVLLVPLYGARPRPGTISIARESSAGTWDAIVVVMGAILGFGAVDWALVRLFAVDPVTDSFYHAMGVYFLVVGIPVVSVFTTSTVAQRLRVDPSGVGCEGLWGSDFVPWESVREVRVDRYHGPRTAAGALATREVLRTLVLEGASGTIRILEPPYRSTKRRIVRTLLAHAPPGLHSTIEDGVEGW
ncbi:MAG: hypothetical protein R3326_04715 [Gemmatimonadota bacterium]|nr:hypothetical protein [Gemmatimonadota bacterium]